MSRPCASPGVRSPRALFPPYETGTLTALWNTAIGKLRKRLNPPRRPRFNPRVAKRKVLKWPAKRSHHAGHLQPAHEPDVHILELN
ncbi:hypothetical protein DAD99_13305 [Pseudarthrobacter sp. AB1]|nr:hypothetical protein [Pseudarthrobacter sp. AB1]